MYRLLCELQSVRCINHPHAKEKSLNADYFLEKINKYTDIRDLDAGTIRKLTEKISVHKTEMVDGHRAQHITTHYNGIGAIVLPTPT